MRIIVNLAIFFIVLRASNLYAQSSIIETALKARESIVTIKALNASLHQSPKMSTAFDPGSGQILVAKNYRTTSLVKTGAGVIITSSGLIVTNLHTIAHANRLSISLYDGTSLGAKIAHVLPKHDLALLKVDSSVPLKPIDFTDSNSIQLGDKIFNIGNSGILKETLSEGVITGLGTSFNKDNQNNQAVELIEVNINLYKGDSGGPLLDSQGRLIGMIVAKLRNADKATFAIPSNKIKILYLDFIN